MNRFGWLSQPWQEPASLIAGSRSRGSRSSTPKSCATRGEGGGPGEAGENDDELYDQAVRMVVAERQASASFLQRRMRIGSSRAARLIDLMERDGLLGPSQGSKPREVLVKPDYYAEIDLAKKDFEDV